MLTLDPIRGNGKSPIDFSKARIQYMVGHTFPTSLSLSFTYPKGKTKDHLGPVPWLPLILMTQCPQKVFLPDEYRLFIAVSSKTLSAIMLAPVLWHLHWYTHFSIHLSTRTHLVTKNANGFWKRNISISNLRCSSPSQSPSSSSPLHHCTK